MKQGAFRKNRKGQSRKGTRTKGAAKSRKGGPNRKSKKISKKTGGVIVRSSGRREKFDTDRMAKTIGRSGVPFIMARDIANKVSRKVMLQKSAKARSKSRAPRSVKASTVRKLVADELRKRNRPDIAASYAGEAPTNAYPGRDGMENATEPVRDIVAANRSKLLFDGASRSAKSTKAA